MKEKPRPASEGFFAYKLLVHIVIEGFVVGLLTLLSYIIGNRVSHSVGQTMAFLTLSSCQLFHAYNVKTDMSVFRKGILNNKALNIAFVVGFVLQLMVIYIPGLNNVVFDLVALNFKYLLISVGLAFSIVIFMEVAKLFGYRKK